LNGVWITWLIDQISMIKFNAVDNLWGQQKQVTAWGVCVLITDASGWLYSVYRGEKLGKIACFI
jgi:hypothetical protein